MDELRDKSIEQIVCYMDGDIEMGTKLPCSRPTSLGDNTEDYITGEETVYFDLRFTLTKINGETKSCSIWKRKTTITLVILWSQEGLYIPQG